MVWMRFSLGNPILLLGTIAIFTGATILLRAPAKPSGLTLWVFADLHARTYRSTIDKFERETGIAVNIELLSGRAMPVRLQSLFMSGATGSVLPDLVEVEIGWVGRFFRPPLSEIGFTPLDALLKSSGWDHRVVQQRFAPWSKQGVVFGVPHDVHPVTITYRKDLFDEAGVDLEAAATWSDFQDKCLEFKRYWSSRGYPQRHAIELPQSSSDWLITMLLQRGISLVDDRENIHFTDPRVAQTIAFYAQLVAGPRQIASESVGLQTGMWINDLLAGNLCAFMTPDWRISTPKQDAPHLAGRMRMMALPRFDPTDAPTSTAGGTMMGIPRYAARKEDAWKLLEFLYLSDAGLKARQQSSNILPPVIAQWDDPVYHREDPYFAGQKVDELYIHLARQTPARYVTPASSIAGTQLSFIVHRAVEHLKRYGPDRLEDMCRVWCEQADVDLRQRIEHGKLSQ